MFARAHGGQFILRIEDTDQSRSVPGAIEEIYDGLRWLGLEWDEGPDKGGEYGPYIQSQRLERYQHWAHWLVEQGLAYKCYATPAELKRAKEIAERSRGGNYIGYERIYRFITPAERAKIEQERTSYVIRLAMPLEGETVVQDLVRGTVRFANTELSDIVLLKSDGFPTYHLAMAVDDHFMQISHVMRSEEWLPSLPMHQNLYAVLGWEAPHFAHLPIMVYQGKKISKRNPPKLPDGTPIPVFVSQYKEHGYQPEAVINWLANIGWSFGDDIEIYPIEEAIKRFTIERINNAPTEMPFSKLDHINGQYIQAMPLEAFVTALVAPLEAAYGSINLEQLRTIAPAIQERVNPIKSVPPLLAFLFGSFSPPNRDQLIPKGLDAVQTLHLLKRASEVLAGLSDFSASAQEAPLRALVDELGLKAAQLFNTLRWAVTGQQVAPPLFDSFAALGQAQTLARLQAAQQLLDGS
jgi:glutamyl-tRNA synthetase